MFATNIIIMKKIIMFFTCNLLSLFLFSQNNSIKNDKSTAIKIFIECSTCDFEYIKQEITYVNYVRDPKEAQLHILVSSQITGSGGSEYKLFFSGQ